MYDIYVYDAIKLYNTQDIIKKKNDIEKIHKKYLFTILFYNHTILF